MFGKFLDKSLEIINNRPIDEIKDYLSWRLTNSLLNWVDEASAKLTFDFYEKVISGKITDNPVWKRAVMKANRLIIGEILGQEYAAIHFPESSKKAVQSIVDDVRSAYHTRIDKVTWMKQATKKLAHIKLDNTKLLIGYPSKWQNFTKLNFKNDNQLANILISNKFSSEIDIATIGKKPDPEKWQMDAHTVNAYYDPNKLVMCFPAGILQPPFYDPTASYATNMGGIGAVVGHELTHGFDDQGSQFDEHGNVKKWQSNAETISFIKLTKPIIDQANKFETVPGTFLQGKLIIGEAIADVGGIELAIEALRAKLKSKNIEPQLRELFVSSATVESSSQRNEYSIRQALNDPHPPSKFRINCVVPHIDTFYSTYDVTPKDRLYLPPNKRSHIW
jgi:predicted metalloendopeptidase